MADVVPRTERSRADFTVPGGCSLCGGTLSVRISEGAGAYGVCPTCNHVARLTLEMGKAGVRVVLPTAGQA
jgi:hypothetical protein